MICYSDKEIEKAANELGTQLSLHRQLKQTVKKIKCSQNIFTYILLIILTIDNQYIKKI